MRISDWSSDVCSSDLGRAVSIDLYGLLGIGMPKSIRLQDGDRIIVPVIGDTVAVTGSVARPGIYELRDGATVGGILDYAGGAVRPRGSSVSISRINSGGGEARSEEHTSEHQSLMRISYAVFCLKKNKPN